MENNKYNFDFYYARSQRMAGFLMMKGFRLLSLDPDRDYQQRNVFKFFNNQLLLDAIELYKQLDK